MNSKELENRLIDFTIQVVNLIKSFPEDRITNHLSGQLLRSATSPALNYGEAQGAESRRDFVHKLGIVLKELRESLNCLKILAGTNYIKTESSVMKECNELVSIFVKSVETNKKKMEQEAKEKSNKKSQIYAEGIPMGKSQLTTQKSRWCKWNDFDSYDFYEGKKGLSMVKPTVTKGK